RLHRPSCIPHLLLHAPKLKLQERLRRLLQLASIPVPPRLLHPFQPIKVHVLHIHHLQQSRFSMRSSPSAQPAPAVRRLRYRETAHHIVHHHRPRLQPPRHFLPAVRIQGPHACRQRKFRLVRPRQRLFRVLHNLHRHDRPKRLVLEQLHGRVHSRNHCRLKKVRSQVRPRSSSPNHFRALRHRVRKQILHPLYVLWPDQRPNLRPRIASRPHPQLLRFLHAAPYKLFADALLHEQPLHRQAHLPAIREAPPHRCARRHIQIRVRQHYHRVLPAQFQHARQQAPRARLCHLPPRAHAPREEHFVRPRLNQSLSHFPATLQYRHQVRGKSRISKKLPNQLPALRREVARLAQHPIPRRHRRNHLAHGNRQRIIPRTDNPHHP